MASPSPLDPLDRIVIAYLAVPLVIFLAGWFEVWAAVPLIACVAYALKALLSGLPAAAVRLPVTRLQLSVALAVGCAWTVCGGIGHWVFANADWHLRDAVLHDLVAGQWPVGYGVVGGKDTLLRAPLGYYLPAALLGKCSGLLAAHAALAAWTMIGAALFLLQVLSLTPSRAGVALSVAAVIVLFSGLDILGYLWRAPHLAAHWDITRHLEWWAGSYQYSSMTTQLFWVPNHALGGWLTIGLLSRGERDTPLDSMLPMIIVAVALWSPLAALGAVPFALWKMAARMAREPGAWRAWLLHPRVWAPALAVGLAVGAYLTLDAGRIPKGWTLGRSGTGFSGIAMDLLHQGQFFLLEAGLIGFAILAIRRSSQVVLALVSSRCCRSSVLAPRTTWSCAHRFRAWRCWPSARVSLCSATPQLPPPRGKKAALGCLLAVGAVTPFQEFARAAVLHSWPADLHASLIEAACGRYPAHYVARLGGHAIEHVLRGPRALPRGSERGPACEKPGSTS